MQRLRALLILIDNADKVRTYAWALLAVPALGAASSTPTATVQSLNEFSISSRIYPLLD
jgi:hypothetical protein